MKTTHQALNNSSPRTSHLWAPVEAIKLVFGLYLNYRWIPPIRYGKIDLLSPGLLFLIVSPIFLLFYTVLPLFKEPTSQISISNVFRNVSVYFDGHVVQNLAGKFIVVIIVTMALIILVNFLRHGKPENQGDNGNDEQVYMMGIAAISGTLILNYVLASYLIELFLIKLCWKFQLPAAIVDYRILGTSIQEFLYVFFFLLLPFHRLFTKVKAEVQIGGIGTLVSFIAIFGIGCFIMKTYLGPDEIIYRSSTIAQQEVLITPLGHDGSVEFNSFHENDRQYLKATFNVKNVSQEKVDLPYYDALQVRFQVDSILLLEQGEVLNENFTFHIEKANTESKNHVVLKPGQSIRVVIKKRISLTTRKYLRTYLESNPSGKLTARFVLAMRRSKNQSTIDVKPLLPWKISFDTPPTSTYVNDYYSYR